MFHDPWADAEFEAQQLQKEQAEKDTETRAKLDKAIEAQEEKMRARRAAREAGETGVGEGGAPGLIHAPLVGGALTGDTTVGATGGALTGGALTGGATGGVPSLGGSTPREMTESQIIEQEMKDQLALMAAQDKLAKFDEAQWEAAPATGLFAGLFDDPWAAVDREAQLAQKKQAAEDQRQRRTLDYQIKQQERIETTRGREQQRTTQAQQRTEQRQEAAAVRTAGLTSTAPTAGVQTLASASAGEEEGSNVVDQLEDEDVEELANLLYSRLVTRLRRELIIDRERAGLLTDFR